MFTHVQQTQPQQTHSQQPTDSMIPPPAYQVRATETLRNPETVISQPKRTALTAQQQQALALIVLQRQRLLASQQINLQIEHFDETGETNQIGVN